MELPIDGSLVRRVLTGLDTLVADGASLAARDVPGRFSRGAVRSLAESATSLSTLASDNVRALRKLDDSVGGALEHAIEGVDLARVNAEGLIGFGGAVQLAAQQEQVAIRGIAGAAVEQELRAIVTGDLRDAAASPDRMVQLLALRDELGAPRTVLGGIEHRGRSDDPHARLRMLLDAHKLEQAPSAELLDARATELLGGEHLDGFDAAELGWLLDADGGAAEARAIPRELGGVQLGDLLQRTMRGEVDAADRRLLGIFSDVATGRDIDAAGRIREIVDSTPAAGFDRAQTREIAALLDTDAGRALDVTRELDNSLDVVSELRNAVKEDRGASSLDAFAGRWGVELDPAMTDPDAVAARLRDEVARIDPEATDARSRAAFDALLARDRELGGAIGSRAATEHSIDDLRIIADGSTADAASLRAAMADAATTGDWTRMRALLAADSGDALSEFRALPSDGVPLDEALAAAIAGDRSTASADAYRYLATWRLGLDGTALDADAIERCVGDLVPDLETAFDRSKASRLHALLDADAALGGAITSNLPAGHPQHGEVIGSAVVARRAGADMHRLLADLGVVLDGSSASAESIRASIGEIAAADPGKLAVPTWFRLRALLDADAAAGGQTVGRLPRATERVPYAEVIGAPTGPVELDEDKLRLLADLRVATDGSTELTDTIRSSLRELLDREPDTLTPRDWQRVRALLDADSANELGLARELDGAVALDDVLRELADGSRTPGGNLARYRESWRIALDGLGSDDGALRTAIAELVERDPDTLSSSDWARLRTLLDLDADGARLGLKRQLDGAGTATQTLDNLASGKWTPGYNTRRYLEVWKAQLDGSASDLDVVRRRLLDPISPAVGDMTSEDWTRLRVALDLEDGRLGIPRVNHDTKDLDKLLAEIVSGDVTPGAKTMRAVEQIRLIADGTVGDPNRLRDAVRAMIDIDPGAMTKQEWSRLAALASFDLTRSELGLATSLPGYHDAERLFAKRAEEMGPLGPAAVKYLERWRLDLDGIVGDRDAMRRAVLDIVSRDPELLTRSDWARLRLLYDADRLGAVGLTHGFPGFETEKLLDAKLAAEPEKLGDNGRRLLDTWRLDVDGTLEDPERARALMRQLVEPDVSEIAAADWGRIHRIVTRDEGAGRFGLTYDLNYQSSAAEQVAKVITGDAQPGTFTRRYLELWRAQLDGSLDSPESLASAVRDIVGRRPSELTRRDIARLRMLLYADQAMGGVLPITHELRVFDETSSALIKAYEDGGEIGWKLQRLLQNWHVELGGTYALREDQALRDGTLGAHFIRRADVPAFLAEFAWPHTTFHGNTNPETHAHVIERGAEIAKNKRTNWGQGFYTSLQAGGWGDDVVEVAIDTRNPLVVTASEFEDRVAKLAPGGTYSRDAARDAIRNAGHDSILLRNVSNGNGGDWLIALDDDQVKIVVEDAPGAVDVRPPAPTTIDPKYVG